MVDDRYTTNEIIRKFLRLYPNSTFQQIKIHLEQLKEPKIYNQRQGLIKKLNALVEAEVITKDNKTNPPSYSVVKDHALDSAILGERFREEFTEYAMGSVRVGIDENYWRNDVNYKLEDNFETKFVKTMVTRYGFYLLSAFVKGLEQSITNKNFDKDTLMNHALDLVKDEKFYSQSFLSLLNEKNHINTNKKQGQKQLKKLLDEVLNSMSKLHPKLYQEVDYYKFGLEEHPETINLLKKNKEFRKRLSKNIKK